MGFPKPALASAERVFFCLQEWGWPTLSTDKTGPTSDLDWNYLQEKLASTDFHWFVDYAFLVNEKTLGLLRTPIVHTIESLGLVGPRERLPEIALSMVSILQMRSMC